jgi:16S rRNA U1498 N3-methylase RsmE
MKSSLFLQYQAAKQSQSNLPPPVFNADEFKVDVEADIDEKTRLPVILSYKTHEGLKTRRYDFQSADGSLSLPPEVKQLLQKYEENQRRLTGHMAPI